ncbi:MAG TPA: metalloprotease [Candidatus Competibacter sp.]|nr:metalloprotease [Candidatus Competibacter sp.]HRX59773.1 metalloprotease [Candidatus Competibacter sp.]
MKRRDFIRYGMGALGACVCGVSEGFSFDGVRGCCLEDGDLHEIISEGDTESLSLSAPMIPASGDRKFDEALGRQLVKLAGLFDVYPGFGYMREVGEKNANASRESSVPGTRGTVLFGLKLLRETMGMGDGGDIAVLGVCAHEFAHILQFFSPVNYYGMLLAGQPTVKRVELHADYMSGYFIGHLKRERPKIPLQKLGKLFYSLGDTASNHPEHHGTPEERVRAIETGYKAISSARSAADAARLGFNFVVGSFG